MVCIHIKCNECLRFSSGHLSSNQCLLISKSGGQHLWPVMLLLKDKGKDKVKPTQLKATLTFQWTRLLAPSVCVRLLGSRQQITCRQAYYFTCGFSWCEVCVRSGVRYPVSREKGAEFLRGVTLSDCMSADVQMLNRGLAASYQQPRTQIKCAWCFVYILCIFKQHVFFEKTASKSNCCSTRHCISVVLVLQ